MNFQGTGLEALSVIGLNGPYNSLSEEWYYVVGDQIIFTQLTQSFLPFINVITLVIISKIIRVLDSGSCKKIDKTKAKTIQRYIEIYAGPEVRFYKGYAILMNSIFVTFAFGLVIPVLFPITLLTISSLYFTEKLMFAYFYKKPPMYGNKINDGILSILKWAPSLMLFFSYWAFGNREIFFN